MGKQTEKALTDIKEKGFVSMETFSVGLGENHPGLYIDVCKFLNCTQKELQEKLITKSFSSEEFFKFWEGYEMKVLSDG